MFDKYQLPKYTETLTGRYQEPLSFIIAAQDDQALIKTLQKAGWHLADQITFSTLAKLVRITMRDENYLTAPITPDFWDSTVHNFGFEKATRANNTRERHHVRFWKTNIKTQDGKNIYLGTASLDAGLKWCITHKIAPDIDTERELLFADLAGMEKSLNFKKVKFMDPALGKNSAGDTFFTDGQLYLVSF